MHGVLSRSNPVQATQKTSMNSHAFNITPCTGITVPVPGATHAIGSLQYDRLKTEYSKAVEHVEADKTSTYNDGVEDRSF